VKQDKKANDKGSSVSYNLDLYRKAMKLAYDYQKKRTEQEKDSYIKKEELKQEQKNRQLMILT